jgi:transcriptional regulator with XRE-family HTH domain
MVIALKAPPLEPVAHNLRRIRLQRELSLSGLARVAGVSKSTLSELERGRGNPSIDTLWALASALNVPFSGLFEEGGNGDIRVVRLDKTPVVSQDGDTFRSRHLVTGHAPREVELFVVDLARNSRRDAAGHSPGVVEHVIVMDGCADVGPLGRSEVLEVGDCITFPADRPHIYRAFDDPLRLLVVHEYR